MRGSGSLGYPHRFEIAAIIGPRVKPRAAGSRPFPDSGLLPAAARPKCTRVQLFRNVFGARLTGRDGEAAPGSLSPLPHAARRFRFRVGFSLLPHAAARMQASAPAVQLARRMQRSSDGLARRPPSREAHQSGACSALAVVWSADRAGRGAHRAGGMRRAGALVRSRGAHRAGGMRRAGALVRSRGAHRAGGVRRAGACRGDTRSRACGDAGRGAPQARRVRCAGSGLAPRIEQARRVRCAGSGLAPADRAGPARAVRWRPPGAADRAGRSAGPCSSPVRRIEQTFGAGRGAADRGNLGARPWCSPGRRHGSALAVGLGAVDRAGLGAGLCSSPGRRMQRAADQADLAPAAVLTRSGACGVLVPADRAGRGAGVLVRIGCGVGLPQCIRRAGRWRPGADRVARRSRRAPGRPLPPWWVCRREVGPAVRRGLLRGALTRGGCRPGADRSGVTAAACTRPAACSALAVVWCGGPSRPRGRACSSPGRRVRRAGGRSGVRRIEQAAALAARNFTRPGACGVRRIEQTWPRPRCSPGLARAACWCRRIEQAGELRPGADRVRRRAAAMYPARGKMAAWCVAAWCGSSGATVAARARPAAGALSGCPAGVGPAVRLGAWRAGSARRISPALAPWWGSSGDGRGVRSWRRGADRRRPRRAPGRPLAPCRVARRELGLRCGAGLLAGRLARGLWAPLGADRAATAPACGAGSAVRIERRRPRRAKLAAWWGSSGDGRGVRQAGPLAPCRVARRELGRRCGAGLLTGAWRACAGRPGCGSSSATAAAACTRCGSAARRPRRAPGLPLAAGGLPAGVGPAVRRGAAGGRLARGSWRPGGDRAARRPRRAPGLALARPAGCRWGVGPAVWRRAAGGRLARGADCSGRAP